VPPAPCPAQLILAANDTVAFKEITDQRYCVVLDVAQDDKGLKTEYYWLFDDNTTKKGRQIDHCFASFGTYNVVLKTVSTTPLPDYYITTQTNQTVYLTEITNIEAQIVNKHVYFDGSDTFIDNGYKITDYYWDMGDGTYNCGKIIYHTYAKAGKYTVKLMAQGIDAQGNIKTIGGKKTFVIM
jgi:PKD repeat protein